MLDEIRAAEKSICFETYIYWTGEIAHEFADALCDRSRARVKVHALLDWYGSIRMDGGLIKEMEAAGIEVVRFRPLKWYNVRRANHRTHRKLLIVDGRVAFTGGVGIAEEWSGDAQDPNHWRDNHYRACGPVVSLVLRRFFDNWTRARQASPRLDDPAYYQSLKPCGDSRIRVVAASPLDGAEDIFKLFLQVIEDSRSCIYLASAYFAPDEALENALIEAVHRGVSVRILICGKHIDETLVRYASRECWGRLLRVGVEIIECQKTLFHTKAIVVDRIWTIVGSANFDGRSCRINDELSLLVHDPDFAELHVKVFGDDCASGAAVTLDDWRYRPVKQRLLDWMASWLRPQL